MVSVCLNKAGTILASTSLDSQIRIWDVKGKQQTRVIDAGPVEAWSCTFTHDSKYIATGTHAGNINFFNVETGEREQTFETKGKFVMSVAVSPNGLSLACGSESGEIYIFDVSTGRLVSSMAFA